MAAKVANSSKKFGSYVGSGVSVGIGVGVSVIVRLGVIVLVSVVVDVRVMVGESVALGVNVMLGVTTGDGVRLGRSTSVGRSALSCGCAEHAANTIRVKINVNRKVLMSQIIPKSGATCEIDRVFGVLNFATMLTVKSSLVQE